MTDADMTDADKADADKADEEAGDRLAGGAAERWAAQLLELGPKFRGGIHGVLLRGQCSSSCCGWGKSSAAARVKRVRP